MYNEENNYMYMLVGGTGGCSVYRIYKRPDVAVIDSLYRQQISPADSVASIADLSWKELFTDTFTETY